MRVVSVKGWAEALLKIARMTLTIKLDGNWSSFQLANSAPPLSVTGHAIAPSARMPHQPAQAVNFILQILWRAIMLDTSFFPHHSPLFTASHLVNAVVTL